MGFLFLPIVAPAIMQLNTVLVTALDRLLDKLTRVHRTRHIFKLTRALLLLLDNLTGTADA